MSIRYITKDPDTRTRSHDAHLSGGELGDGLGPFRDGVLGELTREGETDGSLDFSGRESGLLVVTGETPSFVDDLVEDVGDETVHDGHGLLGDPNGCRIGRDGVRGADTEQRRIREIIVS